MEMAIRRIIMKKRWSWLLILAVATAVGAMEVAWDGLKLPLDHWLTGDGVVVAKAGDSLVLKASETGSGWASVSDRWPLTVTTRGQIKATVTDAKLILQVEWFDEAGKFLEATNVWSQGAGEGTFGELIAKHKPAGDQVRTFRFKLWVEGTGGSVRLDELQVVQE
jgi:hypothetical protein